MIDCLNFFIDVIINETTFLNGGSKILDFLFNTFAIIAAISIGLFVLFSPKSDGRTKTGNKDNAANAPGCLIVVGLISGGLAFLISLI